VAASANVKQNLAANSTARAPYKHAQQLNTVSYVAMFATRVARVSRPAACFFCELLQLQLLNRKAHPRNEDAWCVVMHYQINSL
jgi:hypothetical protein